MGGIQNGPHRGGRIGVSGLRHLGDGLLRVIGSTGSEADLNGRGEQDEPVGRRLALGQDPA